MALADPVCRNITVNGRRTSLRIEAPVWEALGDIARREGVSVDELCSRLETQSGGRGAANLTSVLRSWALTYYRAAATEYGHRRAGHGTGDVLAPHADDPDISAPAPRPHHAGHGASVAAE